MFTDVRDVKPVFLRGFDGINKTTLRPFNPGKFPDHGPTAVGMLATDRLWLDIEDLELETKMRRNP